MAFIAQPEGEYLCGLVGLVQGYGGTTLRTITKCEPEERQPARENRSGFRCSLDASTEVFTFRTR
jgi:hypothetical protein